MLSASWGNALRDAFYSLPDYSFEEETQSEAAE